MALQVASFPFASVTVKVTTLVPISSHPNVVLEAANTRSVSGVQLSVEPSFNSLAIMVAIPVVLSMVTKRGLEIQLAIGGIPSVTVIICVTYV